MIRRSKKLDIGVAMSKSGNSRLDSEGRDHVSDSIMENPLLWVSNHNLVWFLERFNPRSVVVSRYCRVVLFVMYLH
jgi:hypothetical protein